LIDTDAELREAALLVVRFRQGFRDPLDRVSVGVRSFVAREGAPVVLAQRLKRLPTIIGKLARYPHMDLSRMQDLGGCRAIVPTRSEVEGVVRRIHKNWEVQRHDDYAVSPKPTGYRAVHTVVMRRGRLIEIQLRTPLEQRWAAEVDRSAGRLGVFLKDGQGPPAILGAYQQLAEEIAQAGEAVEPNSFDAEFQRLRAQVEALMPPK